LKPILSRFCEIYIPDKTENTQNPQYKSLHKVNREKVYQYTDLKREWRKKYLEPHFSPEQRDYIYFLNLSNQLYEEGVSCLDIIQYLEEISEELCENSSFSEDFQKKMVKVHFCFDKIKGEFRSEKMLMMYLFDFLFLRSDCSLENVSFL
jgi:hypothetical protein